MTRFKSWVLTDVVNDIWVEQFSASNLDLPFPSSTGWSIRKRTLRGGRRDGVELIEVDNGELSFSVLPSRGMGLWRGQYRGNFLGWHAPIHGPIHPKFVELADRGGLGWLNGFDEWLCRCGLAFNGPPGEDVHTDKSGHTHKQHITLHGQIANLPAHHVEVRVNLDPPHELTVVGFVEEASLFGGRLQLTSSITTIPGSNRLVIHDVIGNRSSLPAELQLLYHCNMGPPFLEAGSRVVLPIKEMAPLTPRAAQGMETYDNYAGPVAGFGEQVYCYEPEADQTGRTLALLYNKAADKGVALRFNKHELPCFTVWKNTSAISDGYVTGLEPATNFPNFKSFERQQGRVPVLPPGGHYSCNWSIEIHDNASAVAGVLAEIVSLQARVKATIHRTPQERFSAIK